MNIDINEKLLIEVSGADLAVMMQGLGELPHKIAGPVETRVIATIMKAKGLPPPPPTKEPK